MAFIAFIAFGAMASKACVRKVFTGWVDAVARVRRVAELLSINLQTILLIYKYVTPTYT